MNIQHQIVERDIVSVVKNLIVNLGLDKPNRLAEVIAPKHLLMWYLKRYTDLSLTKIGNMFNNDHSDVHYACRKVEAYMETKDAYWIEKTWELREYLDQFNFELPGPKKGPITKHLGIYVDEGLYMLVSESRKEDNLGTSEYLRTIIREYELNKRKK
jgi:hypothetical protein